MSEVMFLITKRYINNPIQNCISTVTNRNTKYLICFGNKSEAISMKDFQIPSKV